MGADLSVLRWMREHPCQVGKWCGFDLLRDDLHDGWMRAMIDGEGDMTLLAHRGSYKTTCLSIVLAIIAATDPMRNLIFMRKSEDDVKEIIGQVRKIIQHESFRYLTGKAYGEDYGPVTLKQASSTSITTDVYAAAKGAAQLLGIGTSGSITGKHADIVITDDIVNTDDRVSKAERERIVRVYDELQNIRNPGGRIINTGTPWHPEDAISKRMPNVQRFDCYTTGLLTPEKIESLRQSMEPSLFAANYELQHIASGNALFGLIRLVEQAGATLCGASCAIEKRFQGGGDQLREMGVNIGYVTLHVGLGTFRPVKEDEILETGKRGTERQNHTYSL